MEEVFRSKDGKVRRILVGYKFDSEQGSRQFRVVERPVRECVKLLSLDDTTLLEDIQLVRDASKSILDGDDVPIIAASNAAGYAPHNLITYACNQVLSLEPIFRSAAVDIGTLAISSDVDTCTHVDDGFVIGKEERDMGVAAEFNDKIYEVDYDNDIYDDMLYDDENLILL